MCFLILLHPLLYFFNQGRDLRGSLDNVPLCDQTASIKDFCKIGLVDSRQLVKDVGSKRSCLSRVIGDTHKEPREFGCQYCLLLADSLLNDRLQEDSVLDVELLANGFFKQGRARLGEAESILRSNALQF